MQMPYGGYAGVSQSENVELTDRDKQIIESLRDWDLWGPLIVCLGLAVLLSFNAPVGQASLVFATVFCAVWFGAAVVTINTQLLGGTISFFQSVCVLGYCVFPMTMAAVAVLLFKFLPLGAFSVLAEVAALMVAFLWSTRASSVFIGQYIVASRRVLAVSKTLFVFCCVRKFPPYDPSCSKAVPYPIDSRYSPFCSSTPSWHGSFYCSKKEGFYNDYDYDHQTSKHDVKGSSFSM